MKTRNLSLRDSELVRVVINGFILCALYNNASHDFYIVEPRLA